jgi:Flp pilus assembly protein TadD
LKQDIKPINLIREDIMGQCTENELNAVSWFNGGYSLMLSDLSNEAVEAFNVANSLDPNVAGFYTMRGYCYSKIEKFKRIPRRFQ